MLYDKVLQRENPARRNDQLLDSFLCCNSRHGIKSVWHTVGFVDYQHWNDSDLAESMSLKLCLYLQSFD